MRNLIQKVCLGILLTFLNATVWGSDEIQRPEHEKPPLRIIDGELEDDGVGKTSYGDNIKSFAIAAAVVPEAEGEIKKVSTKSGRRKSSASSKKPTQGLGGAEASKKIGADTNKAFLDVMIQGLLPKEVWATSKSNFKAPSQLDLVDLVFILCAGEKEASNKPKKVYLPFHGIAAGFKGMDEGNVKDLKREAMLNCEALIKEQEFIKVRDKLVITKRAELKKFLPDFMKEVTRDYLAFEKSAYTKARNIRARRIFDETRAKDTLGGDLKANFGIYEIWVDNLKFPGFKIRFSFASEPNTHKLLREN